MQLPGMCGTEAFYLLTHLGRKSRVYTGFLQPPCKSLPRKLSSQSEPLLWDGSTSHSALLHRLRRLQPHRRREDPSLKGLNRWLRPQGLCTHRTHLEAD